MVYRRRPGRSRYIALLVVLTAVFLFVVDLLAFPAPKSAALGNQSSGVSEGKHSPADKYLSAENSSLDAAEEFSSQSEDTSPTKEQSLTKEKSRTAQESQGSSAAFEDKLEHLMEKLATSPLHKGSAVVQQSSQLALSQQARCLLRYYQKSKNCVLVDADFLDLFGHVWGCVVQGDGWVDICSVVAEGEERTLKITRMDVSAWEEEWGDELGGGKP